MYAYIHTYIMHMHTKHTHQAWGRIERVDIATNLPGEVPREQGLSRSGCRNDLGGSSIDTLSDSSASPERRDNLRADWLDAFAESLDDYFPGEAKTLRKDGSEEDPCRLRFGLRTGIRASSVFDPGIKNVSRIEEKMRAKYRTHGVRRVRDVARLALEYENAEDLYLGLTWLIVQCTDSHHSEDVPFCLLELENRMSSPTPLGWRDITLLLGVKRAGSGGPWGHIAEIQLHLQPFVKARTHAHRYYERIRREIPKLLPPGANVDKQGRELQEFILQLLRDGM